MNNIHKISYAIEIKTGNTTSIPEVGMEDGVIRYVTDDIDTTSGYVYENGVVVDDIFNRDFLKKNGIKPSNQSIDIIAGGDYAFLGKLDVTIINFSELHIKLLKTKDLYLVGSEMTMYVIIDDMFFKRWSGVISETKFDDKTFTFVGKDKHNADNSTIKDTSIGYNDMTFTPIIENEEAIVTNEFVKFLNAGNVGEHDESRYINTDFKHDYNINTDTSYITNFYCGLASSSRNYISTTHNNFTLVLNGHNSIIKKSMYVKFESDDRLFYIENVELIETSNGTGDNIFSTYITLNQKTNTLTDYNDFYGIIEDNVSSTIKTALEKVSDNKMLISVYSVGLTFKVDYGVEFVTNEEGKFIGIDSDGNEVYLEGIRNNDGSVTITSPETTEVVLANKHKIRYWAEHDDSDFVKDLADGKLTHLENYGSDAELAQDINADGVYFHNDNYWTDSDFGSDVKYFNYFFSTEFDIEDLDGYSPFAIVKGLVDSTEVWNPKRTINGSVKHDHTNIIYDGDFSYLDQKSEYYSTEVNSVLTTLLSFWSSYEVSVYRVIDDKERGEVPILIGSFSLPNLRDVKNKRRNSTWDPYDNRIFIFDNTNKPVSNLPSHSIKGDNFISTYDKLNYFEPSGSFIYVDNSSVYKWNTGMFAKSIVDKTDSISTKSTTKLLFKIRGYQFTDKTDTLPVPIHIAGGDHDTGGVYPLFLDNIGHKIAFGINSLGVYKTTTIDSVEDIKLKTHDSTNDNYVSAIKELSGSSSVFNSNDGVAIPDRHQWAVGRQITDEENTFNLVTELCKQGFVAGLTDRNGDIILNEYLQDNGTSFIKHNDELILDKSISKFSLSNISKCYNEFTIKYHFSNDKYQKEIGVYKVDEDEFPDIMDIDWGSTHPLNWKFTYESQDSIATQAITIDTFETSPLTQAIRENSHEFYKIQFIGSGWETITIIFKNPVFDHINGSKEWYTFEQVESNFTFVPHHQYALKKFYLSNDDVVWKSFVTGIDDYTTAKELWEKAHDSWLLNKRIRKAPTDRTELKWCIDLNKFYGNENIDFDTTYQWHYVNQFLDWSTQQKFEVSYNLPITPDTVKLNLMDKIEFNDVIITPPTSSGSYTSGKGWLTSIQLDSNKDLLKVKVTFNTDFMKPVSSRGGHECDIYEQGLGSWVDIEESFNNNDDIIEGCN